MSTPKALDAIQFLKQDHTVLRGMLKEIERTTERAANARTEILARLGSAVRAHAKVEEELFYPAFAKAAKSRDDKMAYFEAGEEHALVDLILLSSRPRRQPMSCSARRPRC